MEVGDDHALHSGGTGGLNMSVASVTQVNESVDEERLAPWNEWMDNVDFDKWWGQDTY